MTRREEIIVALLERYGELVDPMQSGNGGEAGWGLRMPATYTPSVRELERLLRRMRGERPSQWWHVSERYIRAQSALKDVPVKRRTKHGKPVTVVERQVVTTWHPGVRLEKVRKGVEWLADSWDARRVGEPMLPAAVMVAA